MYLQQDAEMRDSIPPAPDGSKAVGQPRGRSIFQKSRGLGGLFLLLAVCVIGVMIFYGPTDNWSWDPSFYYAQIRSPIIENDLNFRNETLTGVYVLKDTAMGLQASSWPVGPSILWSPFFLIAHVLVLLIAPAQATGFSFPYIALVSFGSMLYGAAGLFVLYKICRHYAGRYLSIVTVLLSFGATPLFFYMFRQPIMAHTTSLLVSATLFGFYIKLVETQLFKNTSGLIFGILLGLSVLTRWSGTIFAIFPAVYFVGQLIEIVKLKEFFRLKGLFQQILIMAISFFVVISPQMALWYRLHGKILVSPQRAANFVTTVLPINSLKLFFDTNRGVLFWSPFAFVGLFGVLRIPNPSIRVSTLLVIVLQVVLIGYRVDWFGGGGYGARYFIELLPFLAVGFVVLVRGLSNSTLGKIVLAICAIGLIGHQAMLVYSVEHGPDGWLSMADYFGGQPLGIDWQVRNSLALLRSPLEWFVPRPFVLQERQTILVNIMAGVRDIHAYLIPLGAVMLTPLALLLFSKIRKKVSVAHLLPILLGTAGYFFAWSIYYLAVG